MGIIEIIALVAESSPKEIGAGKSVVDLWQSAGGIIAAAEKTGKMEPMLSAATPRRRLDAWLAALDRNADEARAG